MHMDDAHKEFKVENTFMWIRLSMDSGFWVYTLASEDLTILSFVLLRIG
jgi:hypothetical protein